LLTASPQFSRRLPESDRRRGESQLPERLDLVLSGFRTGIAEDW